MSGRLYDAQLSVEHRRIKRASKALVGAVGGTADAGEVAGLRQQRVSECTLPNTETFFTVDAVLALEEDARGSENWPQVTRTMARHHGFELLPLPTCAAGDSDWHRALGDVSREAGDAVAKICGALADDGKVTAAEIRDGNIVDEIEEAMAKLAALKGLCLVELSKEQGR